MPYSIICIDPGESSGWYFETDSPKTNIFEEKVPILNGTWGKDHLEVWNGLDYLHNLYPDLIVVFETFHLYAGHANSLINNSFYTCEVIGVIKLFCMLNNLKCIGQAPSCKKYSGGLDSKWSSLPHKSEHSKDAYLHFKYFFRKAVD